MQRNFSARELDERYVLVMGSAIGETFNELRHRANWLLVIWNEYKTIFGEEHRVALVNEAAGGFFGIVQSLLHREAMLGLRRLTDPAWSHSAGTKVENLTLNRLVEHLPPGPLQDDVKLLVENASQKSEFARAWCNKHIAHNDAETIRNNRQTLPRATVTDVDDAIESVFSVLDEVERRLMREEPAERSLTQYPSNTAEALLYVIRDGLEAAEGRLQRARDGTSIPDDHRPPRRI